MTRYLLLVEPAQSGGPAHSAHFEDVWGLGDRLWSYRSYRGPKGGPSDEIPPTEPAALRRRAGVFGSIRLLRGMSADAGFLEWLREARLGTPRPADIEILQLREDDRILKAWSFRGALPYHWTEAGTDASGSVLAVEALEIHHDGRKSAAVDKRG